MILGMTRAHYDEVAEELTRGKSSEERAAFLFAQRLGDGMLRVERVRAPERTAYEHASWGYVELRDGLLGDLIREAHLLGAALIEAHSHPFDKSSGTRFSPVDLDGLAETAPHVVWRLPRRPFVALVFGRQSFDSLYWLTRSPVPDGVVEIQVGEDVLAPTGLTLASVKRRHGSV